MTWPRGECRDLSPYYCRHWRFGRSARRLPRRTVVRGTRAATLLVNHSARVGSAWCLFSSDLDQRRAKRSSAADRKPLGHGASSVERIGGDTLPVAAAASRRTPLAETRSRLRRSAKHAIRAIAYPRRPERHTVAFPLHQKPRRRAGRHSCAQSSKRLSGSAGYGMAGRPLPLRRDRAASGQGPEPARSLSRNVWRERPSLSVTGRARKPAIRTELATLEPGAHDPCPPGDALALQGRTKDASSALTAVASEAAHRP
jgi:hypothetical protein